MFKKIKALLVSDIVRISSWTGVATFIKIAAQFITSKILAVFVGPAGLAILGQLYNVGTIIQAASSGGIGIGVTKYVSEYANEKELRDKVIKTAFKVTFLCSVVTSVIVILTYRIIGEQVFKTDLYNTIILALGLTLILFSFNTLFTSIINGLKLFRLYIVVNIFTSIINLGITLLFVKLWGVYGALLAFVVSPALLFFVTYLLLIRQPWLNLNFFKFAFDKNILKKLGGFSLVAINNAVVGSIAQILIRTLLINRLSIETAGIWDAVNRLSTAYLFILTTSIQVYYLPTLSAIKDSKLLWKEMLKSEKIILPLVAGMFLIIYLVRSLIVEVLFTPQFALLKEVIALQLAGDLIKIASWILSYTMYAKAMTKQVILTDNIFTFSFIAIAFFSINYFGFNAIFYAYIINQSIFLIFIFFFLRRVFLRSNYAD